MAGFGNLYSEIEDEGFNEDKIYNADEVFKNFSRNDDGSGRAARQSITRTAGGVVVETRKRRNVKMPY